MNTMDLPLILPLRNAREAGVVLTALVLYAESKDAKTLGEDAVADEVCDRVRELDKLASVDAVEFLKAIGLGPQRGANQG